MPFDAHANFAVTTVATAPSPATTGTSLVVAAGKGALFPSVPFNASVGAAGVSAVVFAESAEIVRVTKVSTDTLTIERKVEGTAARAIGVGDVIGNPVTKKSLTDVEALTVSTYVCKGSGIDPTGVEDSTKGLLEAFQAAINEKRPAEVPAGTYLINSGTGLDLSTLTYTPVFYVGAILWGIICQPNTAFEAGAALGANPILSIIAPAERQFVGCEFLLGRVTGHLREGPCIKVRGFNNGHLKANWIGKGSVGLLMEPAAATFFTANNRIDVNFFEENGTDLELTGSTAAIACQSNTFNINEMNGNTVGTHGIIVNGETANRTATFNQFNVNVVESHAGIGIIDYAPNNAWNVNVTATNTGGGFEIGKGMPSPGPQRIRGYFEEAGGIKGLANLPTGCDIVNAHTALGNAVAPPAVPASGVAQANPYDRPATLYVRANLGGVGAANAGIDTAVLAESVEIALDGGAAIFQPRLPIAESETLPRKGEATSFVTEEAKFVGLVGARSKGITTNRQIKITKGTAGGALVEGTTYFVINARANGFELAATEGGAAIKMLASETVECEVLPDKPSATNLSTKLKLAKAKAKGYTLGRAVKVTAGTAGGALTVGTTYYVQATVGTEEFTLSPLEVGVIASAITMKATEELQVELAPWRQVTAIPLVFRLLPGETWTPTYEGPVPLVNWELTA